MATLKRLGPWLLSSLIALSLVAWIAPQQLGVIVFKVLLITLGVSMGYIADRELFKYVTPVDKVNSDVFGAARILARALLVVGVLLALSLGI